MACLRSYPSFVVLALGVAFLVGFTSTARAQQKANTTDPCAPGYVPPKKGPAATCPTAQPVEVVAGQKAIRPPPSPPPERGRRGKAAEGGRSIVSAPGFQMIPGGGSRIFVQVYGKVPITQHNTRGAVTFVLKGARVTLKNNRNPLITRFFNTPVTGARLVRAGNDVHLVIQLRAVAQPKSRVVELVSGKLIMLEIDFPDGSYYVGVAPDPQRGRRTITNSGDVIRTPPKPTRSRPPSVLGPPTP